MQTLGKLWYNSLFEHYDATSDYSTVRQNLIKAANKMGLSDTEVANIRKAFDDEEIYDELGNLKINFTDVKGNRIDLSKKGKVDIKLERDEKNVPESELKRFFNIPVEGSSVVLGNEDTSGDQSDLSGNLYYGKYKLNITVPGYISFSTTVELDKGIVNEITVKLVEEGSDFRVVVIWGKKPYPFYPHLFGTIPDGTQYHIDYWNEYAYDKENNLVANFNEDYSSSTITFTAFANGNYEYYVAFWPDMWGGRDDGTWAASDGKVEVYSGKQLIDTFDVPKVYSQSGSWKVFTINNGIFTAYNEIQKEEMY